VLDVGIGTAVALVNNRELLLEKNIKWVGIDYDAPYIVKAKRVIADAGLGEQAAAHCKSVYDVPLPPPMSGEKKYNAVYFSGSITLMPDPPGALKAVAALLKEGGAIYITQTFQKKAIPLMYYLKPLMYYITTIDFGQLTYEKDVIRIVKEAGMVMDEYTELKDSVQTSFQTARLIVIRPHKH
jgi:ubiquinone/menaquinone biosynthesis C-methylase UbiE